MFWVLPKSYTAHIEAYLTQDQHAYCDGPCTPRSKGCFALGLYARPADVFASMAEVDAFLKQTSADIDTLQVWEIIGEVQPSGLQDLYLPWGVKLNRIDR